MQESSRCEKQHERLPVVDEQLCTKNTTAECPTGQTSVWLASSFDDVTVRSGASTGEFPVADEIECGRACLANEVCGLVMYSVPIFKRRLSVVLPCQADAQHFTTHRRMRVQVLVVSSTPIEFHLMDSTPSYLVPPRRVSMWNQSALSVGRFFLF